VGSSVEGSFTLVVDGSLKPHLFRRASQELVWESPNAAPFIAEFVFPYKKIRSVRAAW